MSHVDDGELTAYADGAYPVDDPEALRISAHLSACGNCRNRLEQSQDLRARASEILAYAAPVARDVPPFEMLQQQLATSSSPRRRAVPLAWAATVILALGLGWFGRGLQEPAFEEMAAGNQEIAHKAEPLASVPADQVATEIAAADAPVSNESRGTPREEARAERDRPTGGQAQGQVAGSVGGVGVAADAAAPPTVAAAAPAAPPPAAPQATMVAPSSLELAGERRGAIVARSGTQVMSAGDAERMGLNVPRIPELPVTRVMVSADNTTVEQKLADGKLVSLVVTFVRAEAEAQKSAKEARAADAANIAEKGVVVQSGTRRVQVIGDLPADSLRALGAKVR